MQSGRFEFCFQKVRLVKTGKVTMDCMIGATSKVHHGKNKEAKRDSSKNLPLVQSLGKSQSHLKASFQGRLKSEG
jgi:hypothetical protein